MSTYNVVAASNESTVVTEYEPQSKRSDAYQSRGCAGAGIYQDAGGAGLGLPPYP